MSLLRLLFLPHDPFHRCHVQAPAQRVAQWRQRLGEYEAAEVLRLAREAAGADQEASDALIVARVTTYEQQHADAIVQNEILDLRSMARNVVQLRKRA